MDKARIRDKFSPLLDGELSPEDREAVEEMLSEDADLLRELDEFKRIDALYRGLPREDAPEELEVRVAEALQPKKEVRFCRSPRITRLAIWPTLAAAALLVAFFMLSDRMGGVREQLAMKAEPADVVADSPASETVQRKLNKYETPARRAVAADALADVEAAPERAEEPPSARESGDMAFRSAPRASEAMEERQPTRTAGHKKKNEIVPAPRPLEVAGAREAPAPDGGAEAKMLAGEAEESAERAKTPPQDDDFAGFDYEAGGGSASAGKDRTAGEEKGQSLLFDSISNTDQPALEAQPKPAPRIAASPPAPPPPAPKEDWGYAGIVREGSTAMVGEDRFTLTDPASRGKSGTPTWQQEGYEGQETTPLRRDSEGFRKFVRDPQRRQQLLALSGSVIFRVDDTWYLLLAPQPKPPADPASAEDEPSP